jgi:hypothetical protein
MPMTHDPHLKLFETTATGDNLVNVTSHGSYPIVDIHNQLTQIEFLLEDLAVLLYGERPLSDTSMAVRRLEWLGDRAKTLAAIAQAPLPKPTLAAQLRPDDAG